MILLNWVSDNQLFSGLFSMLILFVLGLLIRSEVKIRKSKKIINSNIGNKGISNTGKISKSFNSTTTQIIEKQENHIHEAAPLGIKISNLTVDQIKNTFINLPLSKHEEHGADYAGLIFKWRVSLTHFFGRPNNSAVLEFTTLGSNNNSYLVKCDLSSVDYYPEIKIAQEGDFFDFTGKIIFCRQYSLNCELIDLIRI